MCVRVRQLRLQIPPRQAHALFVVVGIGGCHAHDKRCTLDRRWDRELVGSSCGAMRKSEALKLPSLGQKSASAPNLHSAEIFEDEVEIEVRDGTVGVLLDQTMDLGDSGGRDSQSLKSTVCLNKTV